FADAVLQRIILTADEIAGHHCKIGAQVIRHLYRTPHFFARHEVADVNVAELHNSHSVQSFRQTFHRHVHALDFVLQTPVCKAVGGSDKWHTAGEIRCITKEIAPRWIECSLFRGEERCARARNPTYDSH